MGRVSVIFLLHVFLLLAIVRHSAGQDKADENTAKKFSENVKAIFDERPESDLVYVLDSSGSIGSSNYELAKKFIKKMSKLISISSSTTRASLVAFASCNQVYVYFDYITSPIDKNQCTLSNEVDEVRYVSGGTCTNKGLQKAGELLDFGHSERPNADRIIILLTDGRSNNRGDTISEATKQRNSGTTILCIGLGGNVDNAELDATATSPSHIFLLNTIGNVDNFGNVAKKDISDENAAFDILPDSSCSSCHEHAVCACATKSGSMECVCKPGFRITGSQCTSCALGFYKSSYGNLPCTACPEHSTTSSTQSTSSSSCTCLTGYEWNPGNGTVCQPIECPAAVPPSLEGLISIPCSNGNLFMSECVYQCRNNYVEEGGAKSINCLATGTWSNSPLQCAKVRCEVLREPTNGRWSCNTHDLAIDTICNVVCDDGYEAVSEESDAMMTCEKRSDIHAEWVGTGGFCRQKTCRALVERDPVRIEPKSCTGTSGEPVYSQVCSFGCKDGSGVVGNPVSLTCQGNGNWSSISPNATEYCRDNEPPQIIRCPDDIASETEHLKSTTTIQWEEPIARDSTDTDPNLTSSHTPTFKFPIGQTTVSYTASDLVGLSTTCNFTVNITDQEKPRMSNCPSDIFIDDLEVMLDIYPMFTDNSGGVAVTPELPESNTSSETFHFGTNAIQFLATDPSGNVNVCKFNVIVKNYNCPYYPPPFNGAIACSKRVGKHQICDVTCNMNYDFNGQSPSTFECIKHSKTNYTWQSEGASVGMHGAPWPDCTEPQDLSQTNIMASIQFNVDGCEERKDQIRERFKTKYKSNAFCLQAYSQPCNIINVAVYCGGIGNTRSRRQVEGAGIVTVSFTTVVTPGDTGIGIGGQNITSISARAEKLATDYASALRGAIFAGNLTIEFDGEALQPIPNTFDIDNYTAVCASGHVTLKNKCMPCAPGTYMDERVKNCQRCLTGDYQDEYAQVTCKSCPQGTATAAPGSRYKNDCRDFCSPGTFSESGVESCNACPLGTYQPFARSTSCEVCPQGFTTWTTGAQSVTECTDQCQRGYFSDTGFEPCIACPLGTYQPDTEQTSCIQCPEGHYTHHEGSHALQYCQEIDECASDPCRNGATCEDISLGYLCICPSGFTGPQCKTDIDECFNNNVCQNNATCIDGVNNYECQCSEGFDGQNCQTNIDDCIDADCRFGSTCEDGVASYTCRCKEGFAGELCEYNFFDCASDPCQNGATCMDRNSEFTCCCAPGFTGRFCADVKNFCDSSPCHGNARCTSTDDGYQCACPPGYTGRNCDIDINECAAINVCLNGGRCQDLVNAVHCDCPIGFGGDHCEIELSSKYDLHFERADTSNRAELAGVLPDLHEFTLLFMLKTTDTDHYGTPVSYAVQGQGDGQDIDNALTVQDYNSFLLSVNGEFAFTYVSANSDDAWHVVVVTWTSVTGSWSLYMDNDLRASGSGLSAGNPVRGRGLFVVGQEQDRYGGAYVPLESFVGTISQVNVWSYAMTATEVDHMEYSCSISGNALSWAQLSTGILGNIKRASSRCPQYSNSSLLCSESNRDLTCNAPELCRNLGCEHGGTCRLSQGQAVCSCLDGFQGRWCQFDINECVIDNGGCKHSCENSIGSFSCACRAGYALQPDGKTCNDVLFCSHKGEFHMAEETWEDGCEDCACVDGRPECAPRACPRLDCSHGETTLSGGCCPICLPETKVCSVRKDGTHISFDRRSFKKTGLCRYLLAKDCSGTRNFEVQFQHEYDNDFGIILFIYMDCFEIKINARGIVYAQGERVSLPYRHRDYQNVDIVEGDDDPSIIVSTDIGLKITWSPSRAWVSLNTDDYSGSACGLCGNMNGKLKDDKLTREFINSRSNKMLLQSWRVDGSTHCPRISSEEQGETKVIKFGHTKPEACNSRNYLDFLRARNKCLVLRKNLFRECREQVSLKKYWQACLDDACSCSINDACHCESISAYANECQRNGVKVLGWKKETTCDIQCPPTMVYDDCGQSCRPTCSDPDALRCDRQTPCEAGCQCPAGRVFHINRCIKQSSCPTL